jgi:oligoendopeptidase F
MNAVSIPQPREREFLPEEFRITVWAKLKPYYDNLLKRKIKSVDDLERWITDRDELEAIVTEEFSWRYIRITRDSADQKAADLYQYAVQELAPRVSSYSNRLNHKLVNCPFTRFLDPAKYGIFLRSTENAVDLFREENIPLTTEVQLKSKEYGRIFSEMTIGIDGKQMTLQKAGTILEETDRERREAVYHKINQRILQDTEELENLFNELLAKRHQIAKNAGFDNFRDYKFRALGRFDYSVEDCIDFHDSILHEILPLVDELNHHRREALGLDMLRPWDLNVDTSGKEPLRPFHSVEELLEKATHCLHQLHPYFGEAISIMHNMGHLDLESRKGKRPGGYNMPLHATGVPFIFMNATHSLNDMRTLMHEGGHAVHSFITRSLPLNSDRRFPSEVSELASMSMELLTMDHWSIFFDNENQLRRAKVNQLENVLKVLPWIAAIDKFQHWLYTNPTHSRGERRREWVRIYHQFHSSSVDHEGLENYAEYLWHKQLHIFEVPFYYIEYGMAQLGAIAIWKQYHQNPERAVKNYIRALKLGYTRPIGEIYQAAGIAFDFSREYVHKLGVFVKMKLEELLAD